MCLPRTKNKSGFTLIELLVVLAIFAVLIALAFPVMAKIRQNALAAKCVANIRTYGTAVLAFATDNGGLPVWDGEPSATSKNTPQFNKWLTTGKYLPTDPRVRCPLADGAQYDKINGRYRFPYSVNLALCEHYNRNFFGGFPAPLHRVVLAAEVNDWDGWETAKSLNGSMWPGGTVGVDGSPSSGRMPIPRYHGSKDHRGLHFFFMDGSVKLVYPTDGDWLKPPVYAPLTGVATEGYFYHSTHYKNMKKGLLTGQ